GALLVGTLVSYTLFGVATTQAYIYYGRFRDDCFWCVKISSVRRMRAYSLYRDIHLRHADLEPGSARAPNRLPPSLVASTFIGSLVSFVVQAFFALRIWVLRPSASWIWNFIPILCLFFSLAFLLPPNIVLFAFVMHPQPFLARWGWLFDTLWAASAANDLIIASTLVALLWRTRRDGVGG
ncbi:hypothetical protein C8R47DRAFT_990503, partial [Mycena vitilis]